MSYLPTDEDGVETKNLASGSQLTIPGAAAGVRTLRTIQVDNDESHAITAKVSCSCRLRTELITGATRSEVEGNFGATVNTGSLYGHIRDYRQVHMPGSNGVVSASWGFGGGEGILLGGGLNFWATVPAGGSRTFTVEWTTSQTVQNLRTGGGLGYVQFLFGDLLIMQERGQAFDVTVTES